MITNNSGEELGYVSSSPDFAPIDGPKVQDEADLSTLEQVFNVLEDRKAFYKSVDAISLDQKDETLREQMKDNKRMLYHIQELEMLIRSTINKVREKQNGNNY